MTPQDVDDDVSFLLARLPPGTVYSVAAILDVVDRVRRHAIRAWMTVALTRGIDPDALTEALELNDRYYAASREQFADRLRLHGVPDSAVTPPGPPRDARETEQ